MQRNFQRVAIVNRGEPAMRFHPRGSRVQSGARHGSLRTIALFTEPDRHAMFVREADEALFLGAGPSLDSPNHPAKKQLRRLHPPRIGVDCGAGPTPFGSAGAS